MDFDFSEEQEVLREHARRLLGDLSSPDTLRGAIRNAEAAGDPEVGAVILTGNGKCFCAGGDVKQGARPPADQAPKRPDAGVRSAYLRRGVEASRLLYEMPKPTIAVINGPVVGDGIGMIAACDLRFASEGASFQCGYDRIGGSGEYGATWHWTRILGSARARELFFLGNKFSAAEILDFGLYHRVIGYM